MKGGPRVDCFCILRKKKEWDPEGGVGVVAARVGRVEKRAKEGGRERREGGESSLLADEGERGKGGGGRESEKPRFGVFEGLVVLFCSS